MPCEISGTTRGKLIELLKVLTEDDIGWKPILDELMACDSVKAANALVSKKTGRKLSAYQGFTGQCLRAKHLKSFDPEAMKDCARQWRERKK